MLISYAFSPKISVCSKKAAVDSAFDYPLYRGRVAVVYRVFHVVALCTFTTFFHHHFYSVSAHLAMYIVDLHLCWWPPSLYCCGGLEYICIVILLYTASLPEQIGRAHV